MFHENIYIFKIGISDNYKTLICSVFSNFTLQASNQNVLKVGNIYYTAIELRMYYNWKNNVQHFVTGLHILIYRDSKEGTYQTHINLAKRKNYPLKRRGKVDNWKEEKKLDGDEEEKEVKEGMEKKLK